MRHCSQNSAESINFNKIHLQQALSVVFEGGIIAYPTEGVYGIGCLPYIGVAVYHLLKLKQRPISKGLILVAATSEQLSPYIEFPNHEIKQRVLASWPGQITWVLPAKKNIPFWISGQYGSVAVRVSEHPVIQGLCRRAGAIISTSANPGKLPPARNARKVRAYFNNSINYIYPGKVGNLSGPTEIRDAITANILRKGG